ncbi:RING-H2 finger protein ATL18 [Sesamum angolense]|uniref:RING-H2 finger protein ATL18 n=1 Tax=Sesamum angolense TaxID=2727404 RepID=A0AAE1WTC6_9LAMI|nr:RING-H2 finger protein ATL18 [Sesamum angolense]
MYRAVEKERSQKNDMPHGQRGNARYEETPVSEVDLPVLSFQDLEFSNKNRGAAVNNGEEMCSICLMEFEKVDLVNKLPRCGHLFHMECMEKWLDRCQFTCPLCRSLVLPSGPLPCKIVIGFLFVEVLLKVSVIVAVGFGLCISFRLIRSSNCDSRQKIFNQGQ